MNSEDGKGEKWGWKMRVGGVERCQREGGGWNEDREEERKTAGRWRLWLIE